MQQDVGTWLEVEYFNATHAQIIKQQITKLCTQLKRHMVALTYAMLPSEENFYSMIAPADGQLYKSVVQRVYSAPGAFDRLPTWKELYNKNT
jgi:hypothetical protein